MRQFSKAMLVVGLSLATGATPSALADVLATPDAPVAVGVVAVPCAQVPVRPAAAHEAASDPHANWMRDWLSLDWGQRCRYESENAALPPPSRARVVFFGDSITAGWKDVDPSFFDGDRIDRGISGQTTAQMLVRFRADVLELRPAVVHIMAGTNDIAGNRGPTSLRIIQGKLMSMVEQARAHGIRVVLASIPPSAQFPWRREISPAASILAMNTWMRGYAAREHVVYVDYYAALVDQAQGVQAALSGDGVHPNAAGYALMRPLAIAALKRASVAAR